MPISLLYNAGLDGPAIMRLGKLQRDPRAEDQSCPL